MTCHRHSIELTHQEIGLIEAALHTQEKILSVQNRANADKAVGARLAELNNVLKTLRRQSPKARTATAEPRSWTSAVLSALF